MAYADYDYYQNGYLGTMIDPDAFPRLSQRASAYIDAATMNRSKNISSAALEQVKQATCAISEVIQDEERRNTQLYSADRQVTSETVGQWTKTYGSPSMTGTETDLFDARKKNILMTYLGNIGMLRMRGYKSCRK